MANNDNQKPIIHSGTITNFLIICNTLMALVYFSWWLIPSHIGNPILYGILFFGEIYHVLMALTFWATVSPHEIQSVPEVEEKDRKTNRFTPSVDIYITVAGEETSVVEETIRAAKNIEYPKKKIYVLNDGYVAEKENWKEIEILAKFLHVECITRKTPGGAKAGNINHALKKTRGEIISIFDADMAALSDFLEKVVIYFEDEEVGFVQSPQYYENFAQNTVTGSAWEQQEFFFGPIMQGKDAANAAFICGTNVAIRRKALEEVGGMNEKNIAEDFLTSLSIHQKGWKSRYVPEVLAVGLAPQDLLSYYKQQLRWARGSLEVLFGHNPIFKRGLTWSQRREYLSSALFYLNGFIFFLDMIMPLIFLFFGIEPVATTTTSFALFFIPFMTLNLFTLYVVSDGALSFRAVAFTQSSWTLQVKALFSLFTGQKMKFAVTPKQAQSGNFLFLVYPHLTYLLLSAIGAGMGIGREGLNPSVITNIAWAVFNCSLFVPFILVSLNREHSVTTQQIGKTKQYSQNPTSFIHIIQ